MKFIVSVEAVGRAFVSTYSANTRFGLNLTNDRSRAHVYDAEDGNVFGWMEWLVRTGREPEIHAVSARPVVTWVRGPRTRRRETR